MLIAVDYEVFPVRLIMITSYRSSLSEIRSFETANTNPWSRSPGRAGKSVSGAHYRPMFSKIIWRYEEKMRPAPRVGLCIYNVGAAIVFVIVGASGGMNGILLWPAAILHAVMGAMMLWVILAAPHNEQS